jgi:hypothetical protein
MGTGLGTVSCILVGLLWEWARVQKGGDSESSAISCEEAS